MAQWGIIAAVWTVLGLAFTGQIYLTAKLGEKPLPWFEAAAPQLIYCYLWALATPVVFWLAGRFPIDRKRWRRHLLIHLLCAALFAIVIMGAFQLAYHYVFLQGVKPYSPISTLRTIVYNSSENFGIYGLILLLNHAFNYYKRYSQLETQLARAQLQALKMQLHPHFLFNTLHSISALVHKDSDAADKMISRLGDFLRLTLENSGTQEVTLQQELEFLSCYLEIERIRFMIASPPIWISNRKRSTRWSPNLILQPIVENAIRHGIAPRSTPGRIEIRAERENGTLRIQVQDNGPGLPKDSGPEQNLFKHGLGLVNTRARLTQLLWRGPSL